MEKIVYEALAYLNPADLDYTEWVNVGMAIHAEGGTVEEWDSWSQPDPRYRRGDCLSRWKGFTDSGGITGGTIVKMARDRGFDNRKDWTLDWSDEIFDDGDDFTSYSAPDEWNGWEDLKKYLELLFDPDDIVGYCTETFERDGKHLPNKGVYHRTAGDLIAELDKYKEPGWVVGDWNPEAGAWIRFNPLDGEGVKNDNVVKFKYALVESDTMSISDQDAALRRLELPIRALVHSGGKSLHAIVKVDAKDYQEYRERVEFLYHYLDEQGIKIDTQNRNPSRLSRMPGVTRNGNRQYLVATDIGRSSWIDWLDFVEGAEDDLPDFETFSMDGPEPKLPEELIEGVLRCGHKMLISGDSKAGKSFLLMELAMAIAEGSEWLGMKCKQGKVLYINLEIDKASCDMRIRKIYEKNGLRPSGNLITWQLRGKSMKLDDLAPKLIRRIKDSGMAAVILDPIYKVITGDENNASDMANFCNQFDKICAETGCATIYCHHHSKGAQGAKRMIDRASGSGVFARDPDAQLDIIGLEISDHDKNYVVEQGEIPFRMESSLREFRNIKPINFWFDYPIHRLDTTGILENAPAEGTFEAGRVMSSKFSTSDRRKVELDAAYDALVSYKEYVTVNDIATYLEKADRTIREWVQEFSDDYKNHKGIVIKIVNK